TRPGGCPHTPRCSCGSPMRSVTGAGRIRTPTWYGSACGWRRSDERDGARLAPSLRGRGGTMTMTGQVDADVARRRAIEALRAGVPSRDAVAALGSGQSAIEDRFTSLRDAAG